MPHYEAYESFQTKRSKEKKRRAKEKASNNKIKTAFDFVISEVNSDSDISTVIEVKYNTAFVLYHNKVIEATLTKDYNGVCNQILFPGDRVIIKEVNQTYTITNMISRKSLLSRVKKDSTRLDESVGLTKNIAANIDIAVIVVSAKQPPLHERFIDRYLMILENSGIQAVICLNKSDLITDELQKLDIYNSIGIPVITTSVIENVGIEELEKYIYGKQAIFVGNSGVGKSSLINAIMDTNEIRTGSVSKKSLRGKHTTTTSKYYIWNSESSIIDTPGIRSLDISSFEVNDIQTYFPEFDNWKKLCKYKNCIHFNEPYDVCFVKQGVSSGMIDKRRYLSYTRIIESLENKKFQNDLP